MDPSDIIQIIRRRQIRCQPSRSASQQPIDEASRLIVEEYDSLLAEIETLRNSGGATIIAHEPGNESANQAAEAEILGDQGQSGG
jgi:hypothetical protein